MKQSLHIITTLISMSFLMTIIYNCTSVHQLHACKIVHKNTLKTTDTDSYSRKALKMTNYTSLGTDIDNKQSDSDTTLNKRNVSLSSTHVSESNT